MTSFLKVTHYSVVSVDSGWSLASINTKRRGFLTCLGLSLYNLAELKRLWSYPVHTNLPFSSFS